ncbi:MAG: hypothetical protein N3J91_09180 [Verrucomicrobiae bacterium]|nr:hypothetical protein [Verrucomicrobiae bacterium]
MSNGSPQTLSLEEAVQRFRELSLPLLKKPAPPATDLLAHFLDFYCTTRVEGAEIEEEGDMILLEWGANCPHLIHHFVDFRDLEDEEVDFDENEYEWIGLTRQLTLPPTADQDEQTLGLCLFLYFDRARDDDDLGGSLWIPPPNPLRPRLLEWKKTPYIHRPLPRRPAKITAFVSSVG